MQKMRVGVYYRNSDVRLEEQPVPQAGDHDIVIKVMACGLCGSDLLEWYRIKRAPLVLGHEPAGEIIAAGKAVTSCRVGDRVFVTHHVPCDECYYCRSGHETACETFQTVNNFEPGGFSQYLKVSGRSVRTGTFVLPEKITWDQATFIEPLGTTVRAMRTLQLKPGQSVYVGGAGIAGLLLVKLARALGAGTVIAADLSSSRLEKAREFGADLCLTPADDIAARVQEVTNGRGADLAVLCAGSVPAARTTINTLARGGTMLFFAVPRPGQTIPLDFNPYWRNDITFTTCYGAAPRDNAQALALLQHGSVIVEDMITHRFGIDQIQDAFLQGGRPDQGLKILVYPHQ